MNFASFFAGVGGIDLGFSQAGFKSVFANEIDPYPAKTLALNHKNTLISVKDIKEIDIENLPDFEILLAGFPCQAFSIAGYRKGFDDERGELYFDVLRIIKQKKPRFILLENVKNLVSHDKGNTFSIIVKSLEENGYHVKSEVLNASDYGNIPQNRERIYIVAFKYKKDYDCFVFPTKIPLTTKLSDLIDYNTKFESKYYYTDDNCSFYNELESNMSNKDSIYQWRRVYVRENKSNLCPTLTANMGTGGHNVPLIKTKYGIRKLTPAECFRLQGFPMDYKLPEQANTRLYKQAGNSVVVPVITRIALEIKKVIEKASD